MLLFASSSHGFRALVYYRMKKTPLYIKEFNVLYNVSGAEQKGRQSSKEMAHAFPHSLRKVINVEKISSRLISEIACYVVHGCELYYRYQSGLMRVATPL